MQLCGIKVRSKLRLAAKCQYGERDEYSLQDFEGEVGVIRATELFLNNL
jgi:hypothetical protein